MADPLRNLNLNSTPQTEAIPGKNQIQNNASGYVFGVTDQTRLLRFLVLGTEGGTFYVNERKHTLDNVDVVIRLAATDGLNLVKTLREVSLAGRAPKVEPTLYALAVATASPDLATRKAAYEAIPVICRTGTHLFTFAEYVQKQRGWGRGLRTAVSNWYMDKEAKDVAYQAVKYRQREGWTHRDLLRLAHPKTKDQELQTVFNFICDRPGVEFAGNVPQVIKGFIEAQKTTDPKIAAKLVTEYGLPWEALSTDVLNSPVVWEAIIDKGIGVTALIRQLARLTRIGVIAPLGDNNSKIISKITNVDALKKGRVHPLQVLDALLTYGSGKSARGSSTWKPVQEITDALDSAFYASFGAVEPANKRTLLALDVSGSMSWENIAGSATLTPATASAALALITAATEPQYATMAFADTLKDLKIGPKDTLEAAISKTRGINFGGTDCSLPMIWAQQNKVNVDTFVVYTDNETYAGRSHPFQALKDYRRATGIDAKLVVVGMVSTGFSIADLSDPGMLDVVGFDTATPNLISGFSRGDF